ncbi:RNA polymerase sigma factor rpoD [Monoraphidium neglectum]|uniref:RNA polymerase sigma factor rpoD n=1 Tax=Monoraphidium neglectum TaxID=145388 RepID=A0A0D2M2X1_9CHLO|nr:RNA polymerase sigma factor rpoD [Monoraphidium neglectum]KIY97969.1 RNA polymerase sigma factor rpoD [Monoraphidium neglectum]|eukprot:XP_013896989.1 RNA polymerase sigma factor rpoD [Monoraphidium neglectum]
MTGFFQEASRNDLLSAEQEKDLYLLVQQHLKYEELGRELTERLGGRTPTDEEWAEAAGATGPESFRAARQAAAAAKQLMVRANMRLVVSVCKKYQNLGMCMSDLVSEGIAGLVKGVEKFDGSKGFKFSTYAHWWIRQGVTRALTDQGRLVRLPVHMQELLSRAQRTSKEMEAQLMRKPTRAEVAQQMGVEVEKLDETYQYLQAVRSLEGAVGGDAEGATLGDTVEDESALDADEASLMAGLRDDMARLLERLPAREAAVMRMRYGLEGEAYTLDDIGRILKITRERVRQIEAKALRALRSDMGTMEGSMGEYSDASFGDERLAARTSSGTKKT